MRVLVTGGTGTLGRVLVPQLVAAGHDVSVLSRRDGVAVRRGGCNRSRRRIPLGDSSSS